MSVYILHFDGGAETARKIASALEGEVMPIQAGGDAATEAGKALASRWKRAKGFVFVGALAVAVRALAPLLLEERAKEPALAVVTEDGALALPVLAGHAGTASDLARRCAEALAEEGAAFVPLADADRCGRTPPDLWAARRGYPILLRGALASTVRKVTEGSEIGVWIDPVLEEYGIALPFPAGYTVTPQRGEADIIVSPRQIQKLKGAKPQIVPKIFAADVRCGHGADTEEIERALHGALLAYPDGPFLQEALAELRTSAADAEEPGLLAVAAAHEWPLAAIPGETGGAGKPTAGRGERKGQPARSVPKAQKPLGLFEEVAGDDRSEPGVAATLQLLRPHGRGSLSVVGGGPGDARFLTGEARDAIRAADLVAGHKIYLDLLPPPWLAGKIVERFGTAEMEAHAEIAAVHAERGYHVALVCGGDPTLSGLGTLALQAALARDGEPLSVRIVPGVTAAQAAGVAVGAPYANGVTQLSLSDLQPWPDVVRAMEGAAAGGLAVVLYNLAKRDLGGKLSEVCRVFAGRRAILVNDAGRRDESVWEQNAEDLSEDEIDARTLIVFPSSRTKELRRRSGGSEETVWVETRGAAE